MRKINIFDNQIKIVLSGLNGIITARSVEITDYSLLILNVTWT